MLARSSILRRAARCRSAKPARASSAARSASRHPVGRRVLFQSRPLPCTYLDDYDYVFGPAEKLEYIFGRVADKGYSIVAVLNSPGASLIGDDLQRYLDWAKLSVPTIVLDKPHFTEPFESGWTEAASTVIEALAPGEVKPQDKTVNLVGLSIWQKHWKGSRAELERLLALCGVPRPLCLTGRLHGRADQATTGCGVQRGRSR